MLILFYRYFLFLHILGFGFIYGDSFKENSVRINGISYLSSYHLQKQVPKLVVRWDPLSQKILILYSRQSIATELDADFYVSNGVRYDLENKILYTKSGVFLPMFFVEKILLEFSIASPRDILETPKLKQNQIIEKSKNPFSLKTLNPNISFIVLDPGHGGKDPGAIGPSRKKEKDTALLVTKSLFYSFKRLFPKVKVYITRFEDNYLSLEQRIKIANRKNKHNAFGVFISVHCNATIIFSTRGFEIYYLDQNSTNEGSRQLSLRENLFSSGNQYTRKLKSHLFNVQIQRESKIFAYTLHSHLKKSVYRYIPNRGIKKANFAVLRGVLMPALLLELGYITNKKDVEVMSSKRYIDALATALYNTIQDFTKSKKDILAYE